MVYTKISNIKVYVTNDYQKFSFMEGNRQIVDNKNLFNQMKENNKLYCHPLIVNKSYQIINGQHRFMIAERLKLPVYYIIDEEAQDKDVQSLNTSTINWSLKDHLHYHARKTHPSYEIIEIMANIFPCVSISSLIFAFMNPTSPRSFKKGNSRLTMEVPIIGDTLEKFKEIHQYAIHFLFIRGKLSSKMQKNLLYLILNPNYDHDRMLKSLKKRPELFTNANTYIDEKLVKNSLEALYNQNLKENKRVKIGELKTELRDKDRSFFNELSLVHDVRSLKRQNSSVSKMTK